MTYKLKARLEIWESTVVAQILEQDERFRSNGENQLCFDTKNRFEIKSDNAPQISCDHCSIYLRGEANHRDLKVDIECFDNEQQAQEYIENLIEALADWAQNWEGFKGDYEAFDIKAELEKQLNSNDCKDCIINEVCQDVVFCVPALVAKFLLDKMNQPTGPKVTYTNGLLTIE